MTKPLVVVLDYGSGNLHSATRALVAAGADVTLTADADAALNADGLVVPGVGAFAACMDGLRAVGGPELIRSRLHDGRPVLGICVGHQVMFGHGVEHGLDTAGVGILPGVVERLRCERLPHMGWNTVEPPPSTTLFAGLAGERFYFVHSYAVRAADRLPNDARVTWATTTATVSWPGSRSALCRARSFTPRSRARRVRRCCVTGSPPWADAVVLKSAGDRRRHAGRRTYAFRSPGRSQKTLVLAQHPRLQAAFSEIFLVTVARLPPARRVGLGRLRISDGCPATQPCGH